MPIDLEHVLYDWGSEQYMGLESAMFFSIVPNELAKASISRILWAKAFQKASNSR